MVKLIQEKLVDTKREMRTCYSTKDQIQWPKKKTDNTMTKEKDRQYNDQRKRQTIQWPKKKTDNTMTKEKGQ